MELIFKGLKLEVSYTPAIKGTKSKYGDIVDPGQPAEIEINDVEISWKAKLIEMLHEHFYHEILNQAIGAAYDNEGDEPHKIPVRRAM